MVSTIMLLVFNRDILSISLLITTIMGLMIYYLVHFYANLRHYPPGPTPLPLIGNILLFRNIKVHWNQHFRELYNKYGPVVTVWVGPKPVVFVGDPHVVKEAFSRPEFMGRMDTIIANIFSNADHRDLALNSHLPSWEGLRNVTHMIVRQFAKSTDFTDTVNALVSDITSQMMVKEGINQPFNPKKLRQEYWTSFKYMATFWSHDIHNNYVIYEYIPICRPFMSDPLTKLRRYYKLCFEYSLTQLKEHENTYDKSVCRDVCDMFIGARRKGEAECRPGLQWLTDKHIAATFMDLFMAGAETSYTSTKWMLLLVAYYEDWQRKMMVEIDEVLGHRVATLADKPRMHCVQAFLSETLRYRNAGPIGSPRVTLSDTLIAGKYTIAANTMVIQHTYNMLMSDQYWPRCSEFKPGRFLDDHGHFVTVRQPAFMPFGAGRRVCLGEAMATNVLFLFLVRLLQLTRDHPIRLADRYRTPHTLEPAVDQNLAFLVPNDYEIVFKK